ncbi:penicillin acylase family protein [Shewanella atlantica]|uniref:penicillin acylase family protein n=1 Tax=Shewanella atlantica TaxID=271099 RepID=UPI0037358F1C
MFRIIKILLPAALTLTFIASVGTYLVLHLSLPKLSGQWESGGIASDVQIERDRLGTAIVTGDNRRDVAFALGYAHGQDRFFQMDLLRRNAAGELSQIFGEKALELDQSRRFHQFRKHAEEIVAKMPVTEKLLLQSYANGVNEAVKAIPVNSFEYLLTGATPSPWVPADSLLVIFSMYLDLQSNTIKRDLVLEQITRFYGEEMLAFITQPSIFQAALDDSLLPTQEVAIPNVAPELMASAVIRPIEEPLDIGSNNWAVTGALTESGRAMLSDDMHLSFAVPIIWYRAQLNYPDPITKEKVQVTGVSLPGAPVIVVGSNNKLAWGFTNAYIDTADWVKLAADEITSFEREQIPLPDGKSHEYIIELSQYGPVRTLGGQRYALSWVAHKDYAVDMELMGLERARDVSDALELATSVGIPVQNMMVVDSKGSAAWKPTGAVPARTNPSDVAQDSSRFQHREWNLDETTLPSISNPDHGRLWSANARVMSSSEHVRFGDGGYALGARSMQIRDKLQADQQFDEEAFYRLQLDNRAEFLKPWHAYLIELLSTQPERFAEDIGYLRDWQACACKGSVGYTLVRQFRAGLIDASFAPIETGLSKHNLSLSVVKRYLEPAMWQLLKEQPQSWLADGYESWDEFTIDSYQHSRAELLAAFSDDEDLAELAWGRVNALKIQHPFSKQLPILSSWLDMPEVEAFGDTFMPAVQRSNFGASQRFIVQPGAEEDAIMTIPGGQSGHPLSDYYRAGFDEYAQQQSTPLLPGEVLHSIVIKPVQ